MYFDGEAKAHKKRFLSDLNTMGYPFLFAEAQYPENAMVFVHYLKNKDVVRELGEEFSGVSAAETSGPAPRGVYINKDAYENPPKWWASPSEYQKYVIRHEVTHTFGVGHAPPLKNGICDLMTHQTRKPSCKTNANLVLVSGLS